MFGILLSADLTSDTSVQLGVKESERLCETAWRRIKGFNRRTLGQG